ncbi:Zinc alcohol dehydrogenase, putative [Penicillium digitatum]|uniref:Zinc alcohol dehydrogenase, putative n=3 Tax=Penicillium digitatum TaxID=36651 RepID=K9FTP5_PEND2|nr:Zinc alcohol dehydrogenase, putative [Penicillium digitatum Pd1]EKV12494.1 Zinc alcohol dehydrogenase, putative [Penicillium digitatum PHI26]EKV16491.1 Zinc alcohol dehydrogenase, putative [Penicillium digitatum Pd1]QQK42653.1 Zinc alcohol dehydrogenase, putative [Penicillium digitatum]
MASAQPTEMKAWLYSSTTNGLEKNLNFDASARAPPAVHGNNVLVQVLSASLNPADYKVPEMGLVARKLVIGTPASPGMDFCGRVVVTGDDATEFLPGQLVHGCLSKPGQFGSLGEYLVTSANLLAPVPEGVEVDHAACIGIAGQTAYQSLAGYVSAGDKVFINGGSGGCGIFAIQIAKEMGCHVTTTCSTKNVEFCRGLGADEVIDYTTEEDLVATLRRRAVVFDHIVDHIGYPAPMYRESHHFLAAGKTFVQVGASSVGTFVDRLVWPSFLGGGQRKYVIFFFKNTREDLVKIGEWVQKGAVKIRLDTAYELEDAVKAFEKLRSVRARGKIIVHVAKP